MAGDVVTQAYPVDVIRPDGETIPAGTEVTLPKTKAQELKNRFGTVKPAKATPARRETE